MAFQDAWVVDKTMFDYVSQGGGCACCGITNAMMNWDKFQQCSDWDTDDEHRELFSPWPTFIHEDVQTQRCIIRASMKQQLSSYASFRATHGDSFKSWLAALPLSAKQRAFQVPESEVLHYVAAHDCNVHGPYGIVLNAVTDQIKQFHATNYLDGRHPAEIYLEKHLHYEKGAFTVSSTFMASAEPFLSCLSYLGGPRLFPTPPNPPDEEDGGNTTTPSTLEPPVKGSTSTVDHVVQSFRSDRRLLRLVIVRSFADILRRKYLRDVVHNLDENQHQASLDNTNDDDAADNNNLDGC
ncbi:hypothetical protein, variant 1 [Aphanomyces astaci]|uniref:Uncharacterized protein n=1 Tax=Aphanomyces astaci TaxID=112090 RepID=W4GGM8_APHAT|nr:hypothetical protein, variant 1 [Aphanomyces astaci]ETV78204.1 hypothetical protein, variant 1 [Aphanomyces astaci]|eukprot:XP_009832543.1 hypothetical protein, variant 1 [Aphanomyces astaci]